MDAVSLIKPLIELLTFTGKVSPVGILAVIIYLAFEFKDFRRTSETRLIKIELRQQIMIEHIVKGSAFNPKEMLTEMVAKGA